MEPPEMLPPDFVSAIQASIQDELSDVQFYANIANESPDLLSRELITSIVGDEYAHARTQAALLHAEDPDSAGAPAQTPPPNTGYCEDLLTAIAGELGAVARYAYLASIAPTLEIRYILTSILGDEYGHVRTWAALYATSCPDCDARPVPWNRQTEGKAAAGGRFFADPSWMKDRLRTPSK